MFLDRQSRGDRVQARLTRFAHCVARDPGDAETALDAVPSAFEASDGDALHDGFRQVVSALGGGHEHAADRSDNGPHSLVARFSSLPLTHRVAFALVVVEEFSVTEAASVMDRSHEDVRSLLLATREFLFAPRWTTGSDA